MGKNVFYTLFFCSFLVGCGWGIEQLHPAVSTRPPDALYSPLQGRHLGSDIPFAEKTDISSISSQASQGNITVYEEVEIRSDDKARR